MVIYNLSSIFDRATAERQIAFLTSKVSLVSLAKLDLMMMPRLSLGGTFLAGEGTTRWPTLFFSRSLKCDKDSLNLVMTRPTMNSLVFVHPDTREVVALPSLFFLVTHLQLLACCYKGHLSSLKYKDFRYHEAIIHIRC